MGNRLIDQLEKENQFEIWLLGTNKTKLTQIHGSNYNLYDYNDFENDRIHLGFVDTLVHLGFARPHKSHQEIAQSVAISNKLFIKASLHQIPYIINISSQSVYGNASEKAWTEKSPINPQNTYAQAKYAVETFLESLNQINLQGKYMSLRLASLAGLDLSQVDFISKMIESAHKKKKIEVYGGNQVLQRLDVKDAARAICKVIEHRKNLDQTVYNLGSEEKLSVLDIAAFIKSEFEKISPQINIIIERLNKEKSYPSIMLNSEEFYQKFKWKPTISIKETIQELVTKITH